MNLWFIGGKSPTQASQTIDRASKAGGHLLPNYRPAGRCAVSVGRSNTMKSAPAKSARASRVSQAATPRHLINDAELRELVEWLTTSGECNLIGRANTPRRALRAWAAQRKTWIASSIRPGGYPMTREQAEREFKTTDEAATMLRRILPVFTAA